MGFYTGLSSNGTLIDAAMCIDRIAEIDFDYVGVSLDGLGATHDKFRRMEGAFDLAGRHPPVPRRRAEGRRALHHDPGQRHHDLPGLLSWSRTRASTASISRTSTTPAAATRTARTTPCTR
jgi:hypothetical protein